MVCWFDHEGVPCNGYFRVVHSRATRGTREKTEGERGNRETWFPWDVSQEQVLREIMQKAAFFTFYMGEHGPPAGTVLVHPSTREAKK